eukprot:gene63764-87212_t
MIAAALLLSWTGNPELRGSMMTGLDGMAFDQFTHVGKFWSAIIAALILLMILGAERNGGRLSLLAAANELKDRCFWVGGATALVGLAYLFLGVGQGFVRNAIWVTWQGQTSDTFVRNLVFFVFIFSFAMLRLWVTLLILTWGFMRMPGGFLPIDDQGFITTDVQTPSDSSFARTEGAIEKVEEYLKKRSGIESVVFLTGFSFLGQGMNTAQ